MSPASRVLITADAVGGVWQYSVDLARGLAGLGISTSLAVLGPVPSAAQRLAATQIPGLNLIDTGLELDWLAEDARPVLDAGKVIAGIAEDEGADILQLNTPALAAGTLFTTPVVAVHHSCVATWWDAVKGGDLPEDFAWRTELTGAGLAAADVVVAPTAAFGAAIQRHYDLVEPPRTVHNGRTPLTMRSVPSHDFVFTAGRLWDAGKNLGTVDAAAGSLGVPFHVAGPLKGPNGASVMFDNLHPLGSLEEDELAGWLAARPVFVSAALYEPFGLAVLEAASAGCALILSDIPTFRELWEGAAVFVPARDEAGFSAAIGEVVADEFTRAQLGRAALERAGLYTPEAMAAQMATIYRELLPTVRRPILAAQVAA